MEHQGKRTWVDPLGSSWESPVLSLPLFVALQLGISGRKLLAEAVSVPDPAPLAQDLWERGRHREETMRTNYHHEHQGVLESRHGPSRVSGRQRAEELMSVVSGAVWMERSCAVCHHDDLTAVTMKP